MLANRTTDVLVIGAGPAGCLAAASLNKQGFKVLVIEKQKFPRFVIGESLLPRVMGHLEDVGLLDAVSAMGFQEKRGAVFVEGNNYCEFDFSEKFTEGWDWTWQVKRADFDNALAEEVANQGVEVLFENSVEHIEFLGTDSKTRVTNPEGESYEINAKFIVDASGYGRVIPRMFGLDEPSNFPARKAIFAHLKDNKRTDGNRIIALILKKNVWVWIIPFSDGTTSVGIVSDEAFFNPFSENNKDRFRELLASNEFLRNRFSNAELIFEPKTLEGYSISTKQLYGEGYVLVGNATEFLDPIFSSGVTFAVESGHLAGSLVGHFLNGKSVDWENDYSQYMKQGIDVFRAYVDAWYKGELQQIFFAKDPDPLIKKQICSVLAGYVWDKENAFVRNPAKALKSLNSFLEMRNRKA